jgi:hypothetical protein
MKLNLSDRDGVICPILNIEIVATLFTRRSYCIQGTRSGMRPERVMERVWNAS